MPNSIYKPQNLSTAGVRLLGLLVAVSVGLPAGTAVIPGPAAAQGIEFGWWNPPKKKKRYRKARKRTRSKRQKPAKVLAREPNGPVVLTVALKTQRVKVFDADGLVAEAPISSGRVGNRTPRGVFSILQKKKVHYSNLYANAPMPNMQRITWSGVAMHAGVLPGYPASHGCIRLPRSFSKQLYKMTSLGGRVIVASDTLVPQSFAHPNLFTAFPADEEPQMTHANAASDAAVQVADASGTTVPSAPAPSVLNATNSSSEPAHEAVVRRNAFREKRIAEMARLAEAVAAAEMEKEKAKDHIAAAAAVSKAATKTWKLARVIAKKATQARAKTAKDLSKADKALVAFAKKLTRKKKISAEEVEKLASTEDELENRITELSAELELAEAEERRLNAEYYYARLTAEAEARARKASLSKLSRADAALTTAKKAEAAGKRREAKRDKPIAVFVSLKKKKIYARQGYEPVLEAPITIKDPERPIGTHVFTAHSIAENKTDVNWSVVSVPTPPKSKKPTKTSKRKKKSKTQKKLRAALPKSLTVTGQSASEALDRITFPEEVREQIADVMKPGSSLIISDYGWSNETGKYTDFIVSLR